MGDSMTTFAGGAETVTPIEAVPDPRSPGRFLIRNDSGAPLRGKLSLAEHAYNILLPPDSFVIIDADEAELFKDSRSDDRVVFALPSDNPGEFYLEQYITGMKGQSPYTVVALRYRDKPKIVSAALYPRDLADLPAPGFITVSGKGVAVSSRAPTAAVDATASKADLSHNLRDLEAILKAVRQEDKKTGLAADLPKESWF